MTTESSIEGFLPALRQLDSDLRSKGIGWALVGGIAVTLRVSPRATEDVDVVLAVGSDWEAQKVIGFLFSRGWHYVKEHQDHQEQIASTRIRGPGRGEVIVDLLVAVSGIETEVVASAEPILVAGEFEMPVASLPALIALKVLAGRDKDRQDIEALLDAAGSADIHLARRFLELIERRGFDRDKDLLFELDQLLLRLGKSVLP